MKNKKILFLTFLIMLIFVSNADVFASTGLTDIDNIYKDEDGNENFIFSDSENGKDMQFNGLNSSGNEDFWNKIFDSYSSIIIFGSGISMVTFLGIFILNVTKLNLSSGNPEARRKSLVTLLWTGIATALLGGVTLLTSLSSGFFKI